MSVPQYLMAHCQKQGDSHPEVMVIVLFGMVCESGDIVYLEIRYRNYDADEVEGDHLFLSLDEAFDSANADFDICQEHWRGLSAAEIETIDQKIS